MSILYDQLYTTNPQIPITPSSKAFQQTTMYQAANGTSPLSSQAAKSNEKAKAATDFDASSLRSYSSTASTLALIKNKFTTSSKRSSPDAKSAGEKQAERKAARMSNVTLAMVAALK